MGNLWLLALQSNSAPEGPHQAGRIWELSKGRADPVPPTLFPAQPHYRCHEDALHKTGWQRAEATGWNQDPSCRDVILLCKEKQFGETSSHNSFIPKWAHALQSFTLGPNRVTECDTCDTCDMQPHRWRSCWQEMKSFVLLDMNPCLSADPEAIRLWTCVSPCPYGQGQHKPPTEPAPAAQPGAICTTAAASEEAAGEDESKGKHHLSGEHLIVAQDNLSRVEFTPEFAPWGKGKFTFKHLQTWKIFYQLDTLHPTVGMHHSASC